MRHVIMAVVLALSVPTFAGAAERVKIPAVESMKARHKAERKALADKVKAARKEARAALKERHAAELAAEVGKRLQDVK
jgi:outer membrane murein-binding lipoprotein Lpp